jgi:hypothetical protein
MNLAKYGLIATCVIGLGTIGNQLAGSARSYLSAYNEALTRYRAAAVKPYESPKKGCSARGLSMIVLPKAT